MVPATDSNSTNFSVSLTIIDDDILENFEVFELIASLVGNENQTATLSIVIQDYGDSELFFEIRVSLSLAGK